MKYISAAALLLASGCASQPTGSPTWYQAYDEGWEGDPTINPVFETKIDADKYAKYNNMGDSHSYEVRKVDFRYQVRIINSSTNELLHATDEFNDAYEYVVEYSSAHADLVIFDLKTGERFEETP